MWVLDRHTDPWQKLRGLCPIFARISVYPYLTLRDLLPEATRTRRPDDECRSVFRVVLDKGGCTILPVQVLADRLYEVTILIDVDVHTYIEPQEASLLRMANRQGLKRLFVMYVGEVSRLLPSDAEFEATALDAARTYAARYEQERQERKRAEQERQEQEHEHEHEHREHECHSRAASMGEPENWPEPISMLSEQRPPGQGTH